MQRIVLVLNDRNANLDVPVIVGDMRRNFGLPRRDTARTERVASRLAQLPKR